MNRGYFYLWQAIRAAAKRTVRIFLPNMHDNYRSRISPNLFCMQAQRQALAAQFRAATEEVYAEVQAQRHVPLDRVV